MLKRPLLFIKPCLLPVLAAFVMLLQGNFALAQKYNFTHYDIEDGLIQSQATMFSQDAQHRLWISTYGGGCRFDGKEYFGLTKTAGLNSNLLYAVFSDKQGRLWLGSHKGLSRYQNNKIYNYRMPDALKGKWVMGIVQDGRNNIWAMVDHHLFKVKGNNIVTEDIPGTDNSSVTNIVVHTDGNLYAAVYRKGIYVLKNGRWQVFISLPDTETSLHVTEIAFDHKDPRNVYLLTFKGLYAAQDGKVTVYKPELQSAIRSTCLSFEQDADNNIWIGTSNGAYYFKDGNVTHFTAKNGFSDNPITDIYNDTGGNVWLATMGSGVFKYGGDSFFTFDKTNGLEDNQVVMGVARYNNKLVLGTEAGLLILNDNKFSKLADNSGRTIGRVQNLFTDSKGDLWIGAEAGWKYNGKNFELIKGTEKRTIIDYTEDTRGTIWMATPSGCLYYENGKLGMVENTAMFITSILAKGGDSVLLGTQEGVKLVVGKRLIGTYNEWTHLNNSAIFAMLQTSHGLLLATDDKGVFLWNNATRKLTNYTTANGLQSNTVYCLAADDKGVIWVGTGRGVNRMAYAEGGWKVLPNQYDYPVVESNQNSALYYNGRVYVGTAKGLSVYNANIKQASAVSPYVMIEDVQSFRNGKAEPINPAGDSAGHKLPSNGNHLSISFAGIYLRDAGSVTYQYRLLGLEEKFSRPVKNNLVDYPSLPPGKYTFEVRAFSPDGAVSKNTARFSFEIVPPFYKTTWFVLLAMLSLIGIIVAMQAWWHRQKIQKQKAIEAIKREEKLKIRQQTAEDFHDDLGNKLTRITVLSEMLNVKIENPGQKQLVEQIRQNAASLYNGTRDILWALDPKSDNLYETLKHIEEIGVELFRDTNIVFKNDGISEDFQQVKLSMEYNRNITMIFKELLTNALKHAEAQMVLLRATRIDKNEVLISLTDDGKGCTDCHEGSRGHGLKNIRTRATRIGGGLTFTSSPGEGTTIMLKFNINTKTQAV